MPSSFVVMTRAAVSPEALFDLSLDIDAHVASMAHSSERAIGGVTAGTIGLGETVTWRAKHFGIWFKMTSAITAIERPTRFVDEQQRGPFRVFRHEHRFARSAGDDEVAVMTDTLTVGSPVFGAVAERLVLVPYLRRLIRTRNHQLLVELGAAPSTEPQSPVWNPGEATPFRAAECTARIGRGDECWERACADVLRWAVKTRSGFVVQNAHEVVPGERVTVTAGFCGLTVREPVEVASVVRMPDRVGFSYRTLPGHPVSGEEAFIVHRDGDQVFLTVRSLTAPAPRGVWRLLYPALRVAQVVARRRYLRALR